jgi:hypothetical protein
MDGKPSVTLLSRTPVCASSASTFTIVAVES